MSAKYMLKKDEFGSVVPCCLCHSEVPTTGNGNECRKCKFCWDTGFGDILRGTFFESERPELRILAQSMVQGMNIILAEVKKGAKK